MSAYTPMMRQYMEIKEQNQDCLLMFRLGDFYELFFEDARLASHELDLTLTGRECGGKERAPMCGVPYHSAEAYIARLVKKGYKVAICEQTEDPAEAKGLVRREVVRIITPGTVIDTGMLEDGKNNFVASVFLHKNAAGLCFADISTGEMYATQLTGKDIASRTINELGRFLPSEVIVNSEAAANVEISAFIETRLRRAAQEESGERFDYGKALKAVLTRFKRQSPAELGLEASAEAVSAAGGLLSYLEELQKCDLEHINTLNVFSDEQFMSLGIAARRNLELTETLITKEKRGTLLWVLDRTKTAMGARLLRQWVEKPLTNVTQITNRHAAVEELVRDMITRDEIVQAMKNVLDLERLMSKIVYQTANARDMKAIAQTLACVPFIKERVERMQGSLMQELSRSLDPLSDILSLIESAIIDDPPFSIREGGFIRPGYDESADHVRNIMTGGKDVIAAIESRERERSGIKNLKVGYNRVFGYYIEVTRSNYAQVPEDYIRKQTLANCERFITEELKKTESEVLGAQDRIRSIEYDIFCGIRSRVAAEIHRVQRTAHALSTLDALCSFAECAAKYGYVRPEITLSDRLCIKDGRHPVVERSFEGNLFVPNDTLLDCKENRVAVITGPNMAGKSTYMRQTALIALMAQMGSFVPAKSAEIGLVDAIYTRVGASDDLAGGRSTFMVEMSEVADILRHATGKSLIILDEIGRGTSTYDGMSIARAVLEHTADKKRLGARTMFATHYHELTELENRLDGIKNYNIAVKKRGDEITFLRKIVPGGADDSFGVEVAKLAGIPKNVIERAREILFELESGETGSDAPEPRERAEASDMQASFTELAALELIETLKAVNYETLTPIEAMNVLYGVVKKAKSL